MSNILKLCPKHFSRGVKNFVPGYGPDENIKFQNPRGSQGPLWTSFRRPRKRGKWYAHRPTRQPTCGVLNCSGL